MSDFRTGHNVDELQALIQDVLDNPPPFAPVAHEIAVVVAQRVGPRPADTHVVTKSPASYEVVIDDRPQCTAESQHPDSNHPSHGHLRGLEQGHPEREHRCPCGEDWFTVAGSAGSGLSGGTPR